MPTETQRFATPAPILLHLRNPRGSVEVVAEAREETVVAITSRHDGPHAHVEASTDGRRITVDVPRPRRLANPPRLDITVRVPEGSTVDIDTASASIATRGRLAVADVHSASGSISVEEVDGDVNASSASGDVRLASVGGDVRMKSASGDLRLATVDGSCTASTASGAVDVGSAGHDVTAKSASGDVTVRDARHGGLVLRSTSGDVAVGVRKGTLVWLDLTTVSGRTSSHLTPDEPAATGTEETLAIRAHTVSGDITITPSASAPAGLDDGRQPA